MDTDLTSVIDGWMITLTIVKFSFLYFYYCNLLHRKLNRNLNLVTKSKYKHCFCTTIFLDESNVNNSENLV